MTRMSMHYSMLWILLATLVVMTGFTGLVEAEAASKAKFKYARPDIDRWANYCKREHPKMSLKKCCSRRVAVCDNRCKKSRYPNTRYETNTECLQECRSTSAQCQGLAVLSQCKRVRPVVEHNVCCHTRHTDCSTLCTTKDQENWKTCVDTCSRYRDQSCLKKYSKREYAKVQRKKHTPGWMTAYCAKKTSPYDCCDKMYDRCWASCDGFPDTKEKINTCQNQCVDENALCAKRYSK